jgi:hypothetical protein
VGVSELNVEHGERTKSYLARDPKTVHCTDCETDTNPIFVRLATISLGGTSGFLGLRYFEGLAAGFTGEKGPSSRRLLIDLTMRGGGAPATSSLHQD